MEQPHNFILAAIKFWEFLLKINTSDLVNTYLSISVTASILFISISLIPFQQIATSQSAVLLKYLRKNKPIVISFFLILIFILIQLILPLFNQINLFVYLSFILTILVFVLIVFAWWIIIKLFDPQYFLLPEFIKDIKYTFSNCFKIEEEKPVSDLEKLAVLEDQMKEILLTQTEIDTDTKFFQIKKQAIQPGFDKILLLKELIIIYINNNQSHLFEASINYLDECIIHYIDLRKKYLNNSDDFLIEFSDDVKDIISALENQNNVHYQRKMWRLIRSICHNTCTIESLQFKSGYNYICKPYTDILIKQF